jgi:hypothetical protein
MTVKPYPFNFAFVVAYAALAAGHAFLNGQTRAEERTWHSFERRQLTDVYYSEGVAAGDLNRDGHDDVVYGPYWFAGPDFAVKHEIYPVKAQPREKYADNFFSWIYDFDGDARNDVLVAGFPGTPAFVYKNPGGDGHDRHWEKHSVFPSVANESPHFTNLVGDELPELVCTHGGYFGYATFERGRGLAEWQFHRISEKVAPVPFGHGLGVGDVNADSRLDVLMKDGWYEQPASLEGDPLWKFHAARFAPRGGAEMYAYDVDGDGDNDVITSLAAHEFGLAWHEQVRDGEAVAFRQHIIMGDRPEQNRYGVVFSELHSVQLADMDGDGLKDIITGKTYWSHHRQSPMWDAGAVVYWFRLVRGSEGVDWVPYQADGQSGIGRQVTIHDLNRDKLPDIVTGGMLGANVLLHRRENVDEERWRALQPKPVAAASKPAVQGSLVKIDEATNRVAGALEAEELSVVRVTSGKTLAQAMTGFKAGRWSGDRQLFWTGAQPGDRLELELSVPEAGTYDIRACLTKARDYGIVQFRLDDESLGEPLDLYNDPDVISSGAVNLGQRQLTAGKHRLSVEIKGANPAAAKFYRLGIDFVQLVPK